MGLERRSDVLLILGLIATLGVTALSAPRLARLLQRQAADPAAPPRAAAGAVPTLDAGKKISVKLYFEKQDQPALVAEPREIAYAADLSQQIRTLVEELIKGSAAGHLPPLPPETKVYGVFVNARGTAFVDVSKDATASGVGSLGERLSNYALVDSIVANFPAVHRVQILVEDRTAETLSGHIDLSRPLPADMTLVAVEAPPVASTPEAPAPVAPPATPSPGSRPSELLPG